MAFAAFLAPLLEAGGATAAAGAAEGAGAAALGAGAAEGGAALGATEGAAAAGAGADGGATSLTKTIGKQVAARSVSHLAPGSGTNTQKPQGNAEDAAVEGARTVAANQNLSSEQFG